MSEIGNIKSLEGDVPAPKPGSKHVPNPFVMGLGQYALRTALYQAIWVMYFELDRARIAALEGEEQQPQTMKSAAEVEPEDRTYELGYQPIQPCPLVQLKAMVAYGYDERVIATQVKKIIDAAKAVDGKETRTRVVQGDQEAAFHEEEFARVKKQILRARQRLVEARAKKASSMTEEEKEKQPKPFSFWAEQIRASFGKLEKNDLDWLSVPIWMQIKICAGVLSSMAFEVAMNYDEVEVVGPDKQKTGQKVLLPNSTLKFFQKFNKARYAQVTALPGQMEELIEGLQLALENNAVMEEVTTAMNLNRIKRFEMDQLMEALGD